MNKAFGKEDVQPTPAPVSGLKDAQQPPHSEVLASKSQSKSNSMGDADTMVVNATVMAARIVVAFILNLCEVMVRNSSRYLSDGVLVSGNCSSGSYIYSFPAPPISFCWGQSCSVPHVA
jgi:hypothetical protein